MSSTSRDPEDPPLLRPRDYFAHGDWPDGERLPGSPIGARYAADAAIRIRAWATEHGTLSNGIGLLAVKTGVPRGTLRHVVAGDRWPGLNTIATIEWTLGYPITGLLVAYGREKTSEENRNLRHPLQRRPRSPVSDEDPAGD
ncbi:hypothetical protein [Cellulomonas endometrii]|uniref:hypothetical protein n=1 Tax=Cellulomonas endometrii TaxID=3036301 RepID=UPI0024AE3AE3|nr:hypothetical protein [Cellulomonas endometrii]